MTVHFKVFLAIDDNTAVESPPFSNDPSVWSLQEDYGLSLCEDREFFAALGYSCEAKYNKDPLFALRGAPDFLAEYSNSREWLLDEDAVGWLCADELQAAMLHHMIIERELARPVQALLGVIHYLCSVYGEKRIRVIFAFVP